jgi:hypothetical protein
MACFYEAMGDDIHEQSTGQLLASNRGTRLPETGPAPQPVRFFQQSGENLFWHRMIFV